MTPADLPLAFLVFTLLMLRWWPSRRGFSLPRWTLALLLGATLLHLGLGTPRWQLTPTYLAAALAGWVLWRRPGAAPRRTGTRVLQGAGLLVLGALAVSLPTLAPLFRFPLPEGPLPVGTRTLHWQGGTQPLNVQLWYPASAAPGQTGGGQAARYVPDPAVTGALAQMFGLPEFALGHLRHLKTNAWQDAPPSGQSLPVVLFFHGLGSIRQQNTFQVEALASRGYLVVGVDVPGFAAATVDAGGRALHNTHPTASLSNASSDRWMKTWAATGEAVLNRLPELRALGVHPDLGRVGALGHSFGGAAAAHLLRTDGRVRAALNLDGGIFGAWPAHGYGKPFFLMNTATGLDRQAALARLDTLTDAQVAEATQGETPTRAAYRRDLNALFDRRERALQGGAWSLVLPGATHLSFTDAALYSPLLADPGDAAQTHRLINAYTLAFFGEALQGEPQDLINLQTRFPAAKFTVHP
ncbi:Alpha/beta hydrolase family protein [Deinococcus reticulitermitis]|uniref:Alpha/beta hydrolase family protein n=1 Tax=Deinococcus reticulitermitis TaxID=856736 RepID=A0A1H6UJ97_9DEIO|nr:alpha/beta fold hydrolase [Deinococcus reticulitermitis]SEI92368.1 Alpha/beta hydrolase family protein [Deinococcus reticulitermitis]